MRIGILTIFAGNYNYGGMLQAYALQRIVKELGHEAETVNYKSGINPIYPNLWTRCRQYSIFQIVQKYLERRIEKRSYLIKDKLSNRLVLFDNFISRYIVQSTLFSDNSVLGSSYETLIVGSDQVWNPNVVCKPLMLDLITNSKKISYAASIGRSVLSSNEKKYMLPRIKNFDAISVREVSAQKILKNENIKSSVVLDPTLLIDLETWSGIAAKRLILDSYVLLYSFSDCYFKNSIIDYWTRKGKRIVFIPYVKQVFNKYDSKCKMESMWDVGPLEFLSLIKYADHIYTDSFHGMVFSILFEKQFTVFERSLKNSGKVAMNSRIYDTLDGFGLNERLTHLNYVENDVIIDYENVRKILKEKRKESISWLSNALNS